MICDEGVIIGCGAIGSYWGKKDESSLFTIFVLPEYQGKGIGRKIIIPGTLMLIIGIYFCIHICFKRMNMDI